MSRPARALLVLVVVVTLLGIGLVVVGLANGNDPTYALFWSTGFGIIFMLAFPLASALEHDLDVCPNCAGRQYQ